MLGCCKDDILGKRRFDSFFPLGAVEQLKNELNGGKAGCSNALLLPEAVLIDQTGSKLSAFRIIGKRCGNRHGCFGPKP